MYRVAAIALFVLIAFAAIHETTKPTYCYLTIAKDGKSSVQVCHR